MRLLLCAVAGPACWEATPLCWRPTTAGSRRISCSRDSPQENASYSHVGLCGVSDSRYGRCYDRFFNTRQVGSCPSARSDVRARRPVARCGVAAHNTRASTACDGRCRSMRSQRLSKLWQSNQVHGEGKHIMNPFHTHKNVINFFSRVRS